MSGSTASSPEDNVGETKISGLPATKISDATPVDDQPSARSVVGDGMNRFTALINDNLIAARFGVFSTIALLTAYGISNTPLFFRYRTVAEIPRSYFIGRKLLYCRIIGVHRDGTIGSTNAPIQITVRHLSPIGMLLPKSWFESLMRMNPSSGSLSKPEERKSELLKLQVAGILTPPVSRDSYDPEQFLERLARKRTLISCQLLGREIRTPGASEERQKRQSSSGFDETNTSLAMNDNIRGSADEVTTDLHSQQVALCKITYRPQLVQFFPTDIAEALVKAGNAAVASNVLHHSTPISNTNNENENASTDAFKTEITDASQRIHDIRKDVKYLDRLAMLEFEAAQKSMGMWSVPEVREMKNEIVDEVDFQAKAGFFHKLWRRIRGG